MLITHSSLISCHVQVNMDRLTDPMTDPMTDTLAILLVLGTSTWAHCLGVCASCFVSALSSLCYCLLELCVIVD